MMKKHLLAFIDEKELYKLWDLSCISEKSDSPFKPKLFMSRPEYHIGSIKEGGILIQGGDPFLHDFVLFLSKYSEPLKLDSEGTISKLLDDSQNISLKSIYPVFIEESLAKMISLVNLSGKLGNELDLTSKVLLALEEYNQVRSTTSIFIRFPSLDVVKFIEKDIINNTQRILST